MRSTIHLVTARDAWDLRRLLQPVLDRMQRGQFGRRLEGVDTDAVVAMGRAFVDERPRYVQGARRPPADALAGSRADGARAGRPYRRPAGPGPAAGPVGSKRADRPHLDRGLARPAATRAADPRRPGQALPRARSGRPASWTPRRGAASRASARWSSDCGRAWSPSATRPGASCSISRTPRGPIPTRRRRRGSCTTSRTCCCRMPTARGRATRRRCPRHRPGDAGADQHVHGRRLRRRDVADRADRQGRNGRDARHQARRPRGTGSGRGPGR